MNNNEDTFLQPQQKTNWEDFEQGTANSAFQNVS